jgi:hypothetical protein
LCIVPDRQPMRPFMKRSGSRMRLALHNKGI